MSTDNERRPTVVIVGAGASGTLVALHLVRAARLRSVPLDIILLDPAERWGRGVAFATGDRRHLLNVPATGMSALPEDRGHFPRWLGPELRRDPATNVFMPRRLFAQYLDETLTHEQRAADQHILLRHVRATVSGVERSGDRWFVATLDGARRRADAVVVATGLPHVGWSWAPQPLRESRFFVRDPWAPGALDAVRREKTGPRDVLLVGTGLTMVDAVLSLSGRGNSPDRRLYAVSRSGRLPRAHRADASRAILPDISDWGDDLETIVRHATQHLSDANAETGDWRPGADGLRLRIAELWVRLDERDRLRFLSGYAGKWNVLRHRLPPSSAHSIRSLIARDRLDLKPAEVLGAVPLARGGLSVTLSDHTVREVGWVVNCTGPQLDVRDLRNPLLDDLLKPRVGGALATIATAGMGFRTEGGQLVDQSGTARAPLWTLGALRRGEIWESTAVPEIRDQAVAVASAVLDTFAAAVKRVPNGGAPGAVVGRQDAEPARALAVP
ncbi:MAG: hypothetical protein QOK30_2493 [Nocardioidaceae bacterium]|jgi:uncharacterized NAD(P)/FAD-binding protein YdhS|nr:hypothetical protein [Nocardioidaceae bacterium]